MTGERKYMTLGELQRQVRDVLADRFALPVWVSAEISEIKVNYSGHCYLELIEKGDRDAVASAQARAVIWRSRYAQIASYFAAETGSPLGAGMRILARVLVSYHELYGFSLQITDIDPAFTLGDMERRRRQTIDRLKAEGVWDMNRRLPLPPAVQRIAVVSSAQAAGWQDFCNELDKSPYRFHVELFDAFMQGTAAEDSIVGALGGVAERLDEFDAVVVIRGGGSRSDLNCFDSYRLCNHVAQFPLPVLTGIGHDKDVAVADMVAHTALKTPTAVAVWLVERMTAAEGAIDNAALQLGDLTRSLLHRAEVRLERGGGDLKRLAVQLLARNAARLDRAREAVPDLARMSCRRRGENLRMREQFLPDLVRNVLAREKQRMAAAEELVGSRSPRQILRLGFAIVRRPDRGVISAAGCREGDVVEIEVADGKIGATINKTEQWQKKN